MERDKRQRPRVGSMPDGEDDKRYPNSVAALVRTITRHWLTKLQPEEFPTGTSIRSFVEYSNFAEIYGSVRKRYPAKVKAHDPNSPQAAKELLDKLCRQVSSDFEYYKLRALSDYLGISESGFLLIAKLISVERRVDDPSRRTEALMQLLSAHKRMIDAAIRAVEAQSPYSFSIGDETASDGRAIWIADVETLHQLVSEYKNGDLDALQEAMSGS